jgi:DNA-binding PadR family transcriptional regulator
MPADIQANLPLTEATFFVMLSLSQRPRHGYAIMKEVQALSNGRIKLSTGTLYGAIKRLLAQNWIRRVGEDPAEANGRARKAYMLTSLGKRILNAEIGRLKTLVAAAQTQTAGAST